MKTLEAVLGRLKQTRLTLNKEKCNFCKPELRYLGYIVNKDGLAVDPEKVEVITSIPAPKTVKEARKIIGMAAWYCRFVPDFSTVIALMTKLLSKTTKIRVDREMQTGLPGS